MTTEEKMRMQETPPMALGIVRRRRRIAGGALLALVAMVVFGCLEEIEPNSESSFNKVYGMEGPAYGLDMIEMQDGGVVVVGNFSKPAVITTNEPIQGPFILRTDANGNETHFRNFYFTRGTITEFAEYLRNSGLNVTGSDVTVDWFPGEPFFHTVNQLQNMNFFVGGSFGGIVDGVGDGIPFYMILSETLKPVKFKFMNNSQEELSGGLQRFFVWRSPKPLMTEGGDILILAGSVWEDWFFDYSGYSIYRIDQEGNFRNIWDYPTSLTFGDPDSWVLDDQGNVIVVGTKALRGLSSLEEETKRDNDIYLHKINLSTGALIDSLVFGVGNYNFTWRGGIERTSTGFVLGDYHIDTVGQQNHDLDKDGFRNMYGGLWFVDENLDSLRKVHLTAAIVHQQIDRMVRTADGGYVSAYWVADALNDDFDVLIVKSDPNGIVTWERFLTSGFNEGSVLSSMPIAKMIATRDGGVAILGHQDFNSTGARLNLIKLDAHGNL